MSNKELTTNERQSVTVFRGEVTGFEQGIAAVAGLFTAGPIGALASWGAIKGVQGKWAPWFILGIPSAIAINAFYFGLFTVYLGIMSRFNQTPANTPRAEQQQTLPGNKDTPTDSTQTPTTNLEGAEIRHIEDSSPEGLKIATAIVTYRDGDVLSGRFRVYCPTSQIRPTDYILRSASGTIKKSGKWWENSFSPKNQPERDLVAKTCVK